MTKVVLTALAVVMGGLQFSACKRKKETDNNLLANQNKGHIVCMADGKEWISDGAGKVHKVFVYDTFLTYTRDVYGTKAYAFGDTLYFSGAKVVGTDSTGVDFTVVLREDRVGTYTIGSYPPSKAGQASACFFQKLSGKDLVQAYSEYNASGSFEITSYSDSLKLVSGKFHFDMAPKNTSNPKTPAHSVKNGVFMDVKLD